MDQSTFIGGAILAAFIIWLAANNRLVAYTSVLWGPTTQPVPGTTPSSLFGLKPYPTSGTGTGGAPALPAPSPESSSGPSIDDFIKSLSDNPVNSVLEDVF